MSFEIGYRQDAIGELDQRRLVEMERSLAMTVAEAGPLVASLEAASGVPQNFNQEDAADVQENYKFFAERLEAVRGLLGRQSLDSTQTHN